MNLSKHSAATSRLRQRLGELLSRLLVGDHKGLRDAIYQPPACSMILHRYNYSLQLRSVFVRCVFLYLSCTGQAPKSCIILRDQGDAYLTKIFARAFAETFASSRDSRFSLTNAIDQPIFYEPRKSRSAFTRTILAFRIYDRISGRLSNEFNESSSRPDRRSSNNTDRL